MQVMIEGAGQKMEQTDRDQQYQDNTDFGYFGS